MTTSQPSGVEWRVDASATLASAGYEALRAEAFIPLPVRRVFDFFSAAQNLEQITPPSLRFRITSPLPVEIRRGTLIDYALRLNGIPFAWRTEITEWDPPHAFTDVQLRGPYETWIHRHTFAEGDGGTIMGDDVRYRLPFGPAGRLVLPLVRLQLRRIFEYRQEAIVRALLDV